YQLIAWPTPPEVQSSDFNVETQAGSIVPVRVYYPGPERSPENVEGITVFIHGGGFEVGNLDSHDTICRQLCSETNLPLVAVDYRLVWQNGKGTNSFDDVTSAFQWVRRRYANAKIVAAGESAGGNLAAALTHANRTEIKGQLLMSALLSDQVGEAHVN